MNSNSKGARNEREAKDILGRFYSVSKVDTYTNHDPFGFVDLICLRKASKVKFVQVKTNEFTRDAKRKYRQRVPLRVPHEHAEFEVWVRVDRIGWKIYVYDIELDEYNLMVETASCAHEDCVEEYREYLKATTGYVQ